MPIKIFFQLHKKFIFRAIGVVIIFAGGAGLGLLMHGNSVISQAPEGQVVIRQQEAQYKLIAPIMVLGDSPTLRGFTSLQNKISNLVNSAKQGNVVDDVSVYFRDFNTGQWMGVNETEKYAPASISKVALMVAILKSAQTDASLMSKEYSYDVSEQDRLEPADNVSPRIELHKPYTVEQLLTYMIDYSDNDATYMLENVVSSAAKQEVFDDLQVPMPPLTDNGDTMSPEQISRFFRILYNSSYLSRKMSEYALELLSKTNFDQGIVAGVPSGVTVAHKYGHRVLENGVGDEFHDCGIVYHLTHPYFLCVMTKGSNPDNLMGLIKQISQTVYENINKQ